jgi:hypothetical protein
MFNAMSLAVGFFGGTLFGICVMALAAAGELRPRERKPAMVPVPAQTSGVNRAAR